MAHPLSENALDEAMPLVHNVERHYNSTPNHRARAVLKYANMVNATWFKATMNEQLVCFCLLLRDGNSGLLTLLGRDYNVQYAYFQMVYTVIRHAIENGIRTLEGGSGAYEMKRRLGFQLKTNNHVVLTGRGPIFGQYFRWLANKTDVSESEGSQL